MDVEELASITVDCGFHLHKELGPGLLESVYEAIMAASLPGEVYMFFVKCPSRFDTEASNFPKDFGPISWSRGGCWSS